MNRSISPRQILATMLAAAAAVSPAGCGSEQAAATAQSEELGEIALPLTTQTNGHTVRMEAPSQSGHSGRIITALIGPRGNDRAHGPDAPRSDFTFLVHPGMDRGVEYPVRMPTSDILRDFGPSAPPGRQLSLRYAPALQFTNYRDPIPGFEGEWLAALAPVGNTGFLILVETRKVADAR